MNCFKQCYSKDDIKSEVIKQALKPHKQLFENAPGDKWNQYSMKFQNGSLNVYNKDGLIDYQWTENTDNQLIYKLVTKNPTTPWTRMSRHGVWRGLAGENIFGGKVDGITMINGWFDSPGHRDNMMNYWYRLGGHGMYYLKKKGCRGTQVFADKYDNTSCDNLEPLKSWPEGTSEISEVTVNNVDG